MYVNNKRYIHTPLPNPSVPQSKVWQYNVTNAT